MIYNPFISIIIPTFNREKLLPLTIESFISQDYPKNNYEILIVDNNSSDNTRELILRYKNDSKITIEYLFEPRQGVHYARNTAAKLAKGEILYYTDDDMIADPNLLSEIIKPFMMDDKIATITGRVLPKWTVAPPNWILELCNNSLLSLNNRKEDLIISTVDCGVISCHQAIKRNVFFEAGVFNPENTAGEWIGDGETGLNIKLRDLGYKFAYIGNSVIYHIIPPNRMTQDYLNKRLANQGNCDSYTLYKKHRYSNMKLGKLILAHIINIIFSTLRSFIKYFLRISTWRLNRAKTFYFVNRIKYDFRLMHDKNWRKLVLKYNWINEDAND